MEAQAAEEGEGGGRVRIWKERKRQQEISRRLAILLSNERKDTRKKAARRELKGAKGREREKARARQVRGERRERS